MHTYAFELQLYHDPKVLVTLVRYLYTQRAIHEFEYTASFLPTDSSLFATPSPTRPHVRDREAWCREARAEARDRASGQMRWTPVPVL